MEADTHATHRKMNNMMKAISKLQVKDKRLMFVLMRNDENLSANTFFPPYGITAAEFSAGYVLKEQYKSSEDSPEAQNGAEEDDI